jgi:hypothetical protein
VVVVLLKKKRNETCGETKRRGINFCCVGCGPQHRLLCDVNFGNIIGWMAVVGRAARSLWIILHGTEDSLAMTVI